MIPQLQMLCGGAVHSGAAASPAAFGSPEGGALHAEVLKRAKDDIIRKKLRAEKKARRAALEAAGVPVEPTTSDMPTIRGHLPPSSTKTAPVSPAAPAASTAPVKATPVAFLFPGQGSQAVGMLKVDPAVQEHCKMCSRSLSVLSLLWPCQ